MEDKISDVVASAFDAEEKEARQAFTSAGSLSRFL